MADGKMVEYRVDKGVALLEINRPPVNSYTHELLRELDEALLQARFDELSGKISRNNLWGQGRLLHAFPSLKHRDHPDIIRLLRERKEGK